MLVLKPYFDAVANSCAICCPRARRKEIHNGDDDELAKTGMEQIISGQLQHRFGDLPKDLLKRIDALSGEQLNKLSIALLDMVMFEQLEMWFANNQSQ